MCVCVCVCVCMYVYDCDCICVCVCSKRYISEPPVRAGLIEALICEASTLPETVLFSA